MKFARMLFVSQVAAALAQFALAADNPELVSSEIEEIVVWGSESISRAADSHPSSMLTQQDMVSINVATTEDLVKYEPSLVIRRRFIGDANGTMGMRGSNMFQTSRSMVFADGVPLHNLLESRWNGAPRWTMISASEIAQVEVLYGPYSAEYSGNAMGGVVLIESAIPQQREFNFDSSYFMQQFEAYGFDETVTGYKSFFSYGDRIGNLSTYLSYNRLENQSQPQTFYPAADSTADAPVPVSGAIAGNDERSVSRLWFGDTGIVDTVTDNYKVKLGYETGEWMTLLNIAYEDRLTASDSPNTYTRDGTGSPVWSGDVVQGGRTIAIPATRLGVSKLQRDSLSLGLRLRGPVTETISLEANVNDFRILRDENRSSLANPADPIFTPAGQVTDFDDTGWQSAEVKFTFEDLTLPGLTLVTGVRYEQYEINIDIYNSSDYNNASFDGYSSRSGGVTEVAAVFAQANWDVSDRWDMGFGARWESFESSGGYYSDDNSSTAAFDLVTVPTTSAREISPKFSLAYQPTIDWRFAYSFGRAYRFPIVEELFSQYEAYNTISIANPELRPEAGVHHNMMIERAIPGGYVRVNLFQEIIDNVIESQAESLPGGLSVRTFIPLDEVATHGAELVVNSDDAFVSGLDVRFNLVYTGSEIVRNKPNPAIEGNVYPRMPEWRGNLLATYHLNNNWDAGVNLQYASDSFGRNDNTDREEGVYGAQDPYTRIGFKSTYRFDTGASVGIGVDNLTNEIAYVAHPWPGRTYYVNLAYEF
ncbi:MAG: TonB-dependent receptor [Pseudohongiellaceae bacterium]